MSFYFAAKAMNIHVSILISFGCNALLFLDLNRRIVSNNFTLVPASLHSFFQFSQAISDYCFGRAYVGSPFESRASILRVITTSYR